MYIRHLFNNFSILNWLKRRFTTHTVKKEEKTLDVIQALQIMSEKTKPNLMHSNKTEFFPLHDPCYIDELQQQIEDLEADMLDEQIEPDRFETLWNEVDLLKNEIEDIESGNDTSFND